MTGLPPKNDKLHGQKTLRVTGFLEEFEKDDIKKNIDIVELFTSFNVKLEKKGKSFMGLCPFHEDKNPSLSVDREKGLYNCFGCGEAGDAFDLVEKMKGFDFKESLKFLKDWKGFVSFSPVPADLPLEITSTVKGGKPPVNSSGKVLTSPDGDRIKDLNTVKNYYHKRLFDHPEALEYLKKRGLTNTGHYERFQIGYSDGGLNLVTGESQRKELTESGIFNEHGKEHFLNCVIFSIFDDNGNTVSFYGRDIDDNSTFKHRYLKGYHKSVFNRKVSKVYNEIIITESIIDALSLIEIGFENVQSIFGTNGFTEEHLQTLKADRVKTIVLALDADEAGSLASDKLKEKLISEGLKVKIIFPWQAKDWNQMLVAGILKKEELQALIEQAAVFEEARLTEPLQPADFKIKEDNGQYYFTCLDITYRLAGVKEMFVNSLKVNIRADSGGEFFIDSVDLYLYRSRNTFSSHLSRQFGIEAKRVEKDLLNILEYLEKQRDRRLEEKKPVKIELTDDDRRIGLELLRSPQLFDDIVKDLEIMGYAGEDVNKQLVYLAAASRLFPKPLSVYIQSGAGSGKSALIDNVLKLMPEDIVNTVTSASDQSFNYMPKEKFEGTIFALGEALHNDKIEGDIRQMQSENMISRNVARKDPKTGEIVTEAVKHKVQICFMMTSTQLKLNPENASRCLVLNVDESRAQTELVHQIQRHKRTFEGYLEDKHLVPKIIQKHIAAQRMLKGQRIFNQFSPHLRFPQGKAIMRRAQEQFLTLIDSVCFISQFRKEPIGSLTLTLMKKSMGWNARLTITG